jgi:hypothetical protein
MSLKNSINSIIDIEKYKSVPYVVQRNVLKQNQLEEVAGYDRHKETRKLLIIEFKF